MASAKAVERSEERGEEAEIGDIECKKRWDAFVRLIQAIWERGEIPRQMTWMIVVLIPKGGGDYRGIGLMEPFWKVIEGILVSWLGVIEYHDCLNGCVNSRGTGTARIEAKLAQQLAYIEQEVFYGIFIDLKKSFDAMHCGQVLRLLRGYGVGPRAIRLIDRFWRLCEMVCRAQGNYGRPFKAYRGVTQDGPLSPTLFNILVDAVVRAWMPQVFGKEAHTKWGQQV